jgi:hypothetical protein
MPKIELTALEEAELLNFRKLALREHGVHATWVMTTPRFAIWMVDLLLQAAGPDNASVPKTPIHKVPRKRRS